MPPRRNMHASFCAVKELIFSNRGLAEILLIVRYLRWTKTAILWSLVYCLWLFSLSLVKTTKPFERLSLDFKSPLPSQIRSTYLLVVVDEYSRFLFCFSCPNMLSWTIIKHLDQFFNLCGMPHYVHSDLGRSFTLNERKD